LWVVVVVVVRVVADFRGTVKLGGVAMWFMKADQSMVTSPMRSIAVEMAVGEGDGDRKERLTLLVMGKVVGCGKPIRGEGEETITRPPFAAAAAVAERINSNVKLEERGWVRRMEATSWNVGCGVAWGAAWYPLDPVFGTVIGGLWPHEDLSEALGGCVGEGVDQSSSPHGIPATAGELAERRRDEDWAPAEAAVGEAPKVTVTREEETTGAGATTGEAGAGTLSSTPSAAFRRLR